MSMMIHRAVKRINEASQPKEVNKPSEKAESAENGAGTTAKRNRKPKR